MQIIGVLQQKIEHENEDGPLWIDDLNTIQQRHVAVGKNQIDKALQRRFISRCAKQRYEDEVDLQVEQRFISFQTFYILTSAP